MQLALLICGGSSKSPMTAAQLQTNRQEAQVFQFKLQVIHLEKGKDAWDKFQRPANGINLQFLGDKLTRIGGLISWNVILQPEFVFESKYQPKSSNFLSDPKFESSVGTTLLIPIPQQRAVFPVKLFSQEFTHFDHLCVVFIIFLFI
jgi:hypothetical protein